MRVRTGNGIAVAGTILVDEINVIEAYPKSGELTKISEVSKAVGGCVPNVAIDLKKICSTLPVSAVGKVGADENGLFIKETLSKNGVDIDNLTIGVHDRTSFTQVMSVRGGERTFFTYAGASADFGVNDINFGVIDPKILHLGYFLLLEKVDHGEGLSILKSAQEHGIKTSIDLVSENSDRYSLVRSCLPYTDYLIINELEAGQLTDIEPVNSNLKKIAATLKAMGVREKVIIHFKKGSVCMSGAGFAYLGSFDIPDAFIKGATGAGDAFCAGALLAIYNDLSDMEILEFASMSAVASLRTADATGGLADEREIRELCREMDRVELCL